MAGSGSCLEQFDREGVVSEADRVVEAKAGACGEAPVDGDVGEGADKVAEDRQFPLVPAGRGRIGTVASASMPRYATKYGSQSGSCHHT